MHVQQKTTVRIIGIFIVIALAGLAGCGSGSDPEPDANPADLESGGRSFTFTIKNSCENSVVSVYNGDCNCFTNLGGETLALKYGDTVTRAFNRNVSHKWYDFFKQFLGFFFEFMIEYGIGIFCEPCSLVLQGVNAIGPDKSPYPVDTDNMTDCNYTFLAWNTLVVQNDLKDAWRQKAGWTAIQKVSYLENTLFEDPRVWENGDIVHPDLRWTRCPNKASDYCGVIIDIPTTYSTRSYQNVFLSYVSTGVVGEIGNYANAKDLHGYILWTVDGDKHINSPDSLLYSLYQKNSGSSPSDDKIEIFNGSPYNLRVCILRNPHDPVEPLNCNGRGDDMLFYTQTAVTPDQFVSEPIGEDDKIYPFKGKPIYVYTYGDWQGAQVFSCGSQLDFDTPFYIDVVPDEWGGLTCKAGSVPLVVSNQSQVNLKLSVFKNPLADGSAASSEILKQALYTTSNQVTPDGQDTFYSGKYTEPVYVYAYGNYEDAFMFACGDGLRLDAETAFSVTQDASGLICRPDPAPQGVNDPVLPMNREVMTYWMNWSVYTTKALPADPYPIPGSTTTDPEHPVATNKDLLGKLPYTSILTYSFLEMITHTLDNYLYKDKYTDADIGLIYFSDPWSDLTGNTAICKDNYKMCDYANNKADPPKPDYNAEWGSKMGNFDAFLELPKQVPGLKLAFSVGGYSHDDAFEVLFGNAQHTQTFVDSAIALLKKYEDKGLVGIDLDYENPDMSLAQSRDYLAVISALNDGMQQAGFSTDKQFITVTILGNPFMIRGEKFCNGSRCGFDYGVMSEIARMPFVKAIQLMTYDFNGAYNFNPETGTGITGFNTNIYPVAESDFSIDAAVTAMAEVDVPLSKVSIGIPAYGRSLANIPSTNAGLFQPLDAEDHIPQGNMDAQRCEDGIILKDGSCSGTFSYRFIVDTMLDNGFKAQDRTTIDGKPNGATAYLDGWWYPYEIMTR